MRKFLICILSFISVYLPRPIQPSKIGSVHLNAWLSSRFSSVYLTIISFFQTFIIFVHNVADVCKKLVDNLVLFWSWDRIDALVDLTIQRHSQYITFVSNASIFLGLELNCFYPVCTPQMLASGLRRLYCTINVASYILSFLFLDKLSRRLSFEVGKYLLRSWPATFASSVRYVPLYLYHLSRFINLIDVVTIVCNNLSIIDCWVLICKSY